MTTTTAVINGNKIEADLETIAKILSVVSNTMTSVSDNSDTKEDESDEIEYINWDAFVENETKTLLTEYWQERVSKETIKKHESMIAEQIKSQTEHLINSLKFCRRCADYRMLSPTYHYFGASEIPKMRQFLKLVSACDRIVHFTNSKYRHYTTKQLSTLRSEIKYARMCSECGSIANKFWDRVMKDPNVTV